jgi:hypothetical protein
MPDPYGSTETDADEVNDLIRAEYLQYQAVASRDLTLHRVQTQLTHNLLY